MAKNNVIELAGVVRNGFLPARELQTNLGPVTVRIPNSVCVLKLRSENADNTLTAPDFPDQSLLHIGGFHPSAAFRKSR